MKKIVILFLGLFVLVGCTKDYGGPTKKQFNTFLSAIEEVLKSDIISFTSNIEMDTDHKERIDIEFSGINFRNLEGEEFSLEVKTNVDNLLVNSVNTLGVYYKDGITYSQSDNLKIVHAKEEGIQTEFFEIQPYLDNLEILNFEKIPSIANKFIRTAFKAEGSNSSFVLELQMDSLIAMEFNKAIITNHIQEGSTEIFNTGTSLRELTYVSFEIIDSKLVSINVEAIAANENVHIPIEFTLHINEINEEVKIEFPSFDDYIKY